MKLILFKNKVLFNCFINQINDILSQWPSRRHDTQAACRIDDDGKDYTHDGKIRYSCEIRFDPID